MNHERPLPLEFWLLLLALCAWGLVAGIGTVYSRSRADIDNIGVHHVQHH